MSIENQNHYITPTDKLFKQGAAALNDTELLSLFMDENIAQAKTSLLFSLKSWRELLTSTESNFQALGIDRMALARIRAVKEISERFLLETMQLGDCLSDVNTVRDFLKSRLRDLKQEQFFCVFMDNKHRVLGVECMFKGTIDSASVHPREVVRKALEYNAAAVILAHNHPSGVAEPSQADHRITDKLKDAMSLIDVRVLDHFVVGDEVVSFAERGYI